MSLTQEQLEIIDDLFELGGDENAVIQKHNIDRKVFRGWLAEKEFADCVADRLKSSKLHSEILLSRYASFAASKLIQLCQSENQETSRKACLDILNLHKEQLLNTDENQPAEPLPSIDPETASKILAVLAESETTKQMLK